MTRYKYFVTLLKYFVLKYLLSKYFLLILLTFQHKYMHYSFLLPFLKCMLIIHELLQKDVMRAVKKTPRGLIGPLSNGDTQDHLQRLEVNKEETN